MIEIGIEKGRKLRLWSVEGKRAICLQAKAPGISIAQVASRYCMNANLIHKWLKDPRFAPLTEDPAEVIENAAFVEVNVASSDMSSVPDLPSQINQSLSATRVDISLSDGRRILAEGATSLSAVVGLVEGLSA